MTYISGAVGFVLLEKNNKKILVLSDVHDGPKYCSQDSIMITDYLNNNKNNTFTLLEEATEEKINNLTPLWTGSHHTMGLRNLVMREKKIKPIDIRPLLLPFSWEIMCNKDHYKKIKLHDYLNLVDYFFKGKGLCWEKYIKPHINNMSEKDKVIKHLQEICNIYLNIMKKNKNEPIEYYYNKDNVLENINDLMSYIMEWYTIVLLINSDKNSVVHLGLAHSERLIDKLNKYYGYKIVENYGINRMNNISNDMKACINIKAIENKFNKKYSIYY